MTADPTSHLSPRIRGALAWAGTYLVIAVVTMMGINWFPVIFPDSLLYLEHSIDLGGIGLVQEGYRQIGYPILLMLWRVVGEATGIPPFSVAIAVQHGLMIGAATAAVRLLRWWATPLLAVLLLPSMSSYSNFLLTEAIAIPTAVLLALLLFKSADRAGKMRVGFVAASLGMAVALTTIRLHYAGMAVAAMVLVLLIFWANPLERPKAIAAVGATMLMLGGWVLALAQENANDNGIFSPSLGSERSLYWMLWETVAKDDPALLEERSPQIYGDGTPDEYLLWVDSQPISFHEKQTLYTEASEEILDIYGATMGLERLKSVAGFLSGARVDDLQQVATSATRKDAGLDPDRLHQYETVREIDPEWIAETYNAGHLAEATVTVAARTGWPPFPYFGIVLTVALIAGIVMAPYMIAFRGARALALAGLVSVVGYGAGTFLLVYDNLRWVLPVHMFFLTLTACAASRWYQERHPASQS